MAQLPHLAEAISDGYIAGLSASGWAGSADQVRAAIATCGAAKYSWLGALVIASAAGSVGGGESADQGDAGAEGLEHIRPLAELWGRWADAVML
ncbi:MAG: hypothetical protein ACJ786_37000 [Catenulispora sp.]